MRPVVVRLSWPPKELSPNGGAKRWAKIKAKAAYRHEAWGIARKALDDAGMMPWQDGGGYQIHRLTPPVVADVVFTYTDWDRRRDPDNHLAMLKSAFDGIVDAGVLVGDHAKVLTINPVTFVKGDKRGVTITLTESAQEVGA